MSQSWPSLQVASAGDFTSRCLTGEESLCRQRHSTSSEGGGALAGLGALLGTCRYEVSFWPVVALLGAREGSAAQQGTIPRLANVPSFLHVLLHCLLSHPVLSKPQHQCDPHCAFTKHYAQSMQPHLSVLVIYLVRWRLLLVPFYRWKNLGPDHVSFLLKITEPAAYRSRH